MAILIELYRDEDWGGKKKSHFIFRAWRWWWLWSSTVKWLCLIQSQENIEVEDTNMLMIWVILFSNINHISSSLYLHPQPLILYKRDMAQMCSIYWAEMGYYQNGASLSWICVSKPANVIMEQWRNFIISGARPVNLDKSPDIKDTNNKEDSHSHLWAT